VEGGITYLCMTTQDIGYRIPYAFLFDLKTRFHGTFGEKVYTAPELAMNDSFSRVLLERIVGTNQKTVFSRFEDPHTHTHTHTLSSFFFFFLSF
jgi:hypothetical protein